MGNNLFQIPLNPPMQFNQKPLKQNSLKSNKPEPKIQTPKKEVENISNINSEIKNMFTSSKVYPSRKTSMDLPMTSDLLSSEFFSKKSISQIEEIIGPSIKTMTYNDYEFHFFRNEQEIRNTYFAKLIYKNVLCSQVRPKTFNSLIILDWDDTLMSTTYLLGKNKILNEDDIKEYKLLGEEVKKLLSLCKSTGTIIILTNSTKAWVFSTAKKYLFIEDSVFDDVLIFSTRERFCDRFPMTLWKSKAYVEIEHQINQSKSIICIGDSENDIEEGKKLKKKFPSLNVATVKFINKPSHPSELISEIKVVIKHFDTLLNSNYNMYIEQ